MNELSIFVDESGDFGEFEKHTPFYIISLVLHAQSVDISSDLDKLEQEMRYLGLPNHCIHAGPIIRSEHEYKDYSLGEKQKILKNLMAFIRRLDIHIKSVYIEKRGVEDFVEATGNLSKQLAAFIRSNLQFFLKFDSIKIYYDNGQVEVNRILAAVFNALLDNVEFRKVIPSDYRLFQVADLVCTLKLVELKMERHALSKSEKYYFGDERTLKKNYLKPIHQKEFP